MHSQSVNDGISSANYQTCDIQQYGMPHPLVFTVLVQYSLASILVICIFSVMFSLIFSLFGDTNNVRSIGCRFGLLLNLNRFIIIEKLLIFD